MASGLNRRNLRLIKDINKIKDINNMKDIKT